MRRVAVGTAPRPNDPRAIEWLMNALREVANASHENDTIDIAEAYTVSNVTEARTLDCSTATAADVANFIATLVLDLKAGQVRKG